MSALLIRAPGLSTTLQDLGRRGYQRFGIPVAGALDPRALALANGLVGRPTTSGALEMRYLGPSFEVEAERLSIAVVGAEIRGRRLRAGVETPFGAGRSITLLGGDRVEIGPLRESSTAYLAISAEIAGAPVLGSQATYVKGGFGGFEGRALQAGDKITLDRIVPPGFDQALAAPVDLTPPERIRVVLGPQQDHFTEAAVATFLTAEWLVTKDADRMGMRLEGPELAHCDGYNIASDGIAPGSIQVPGSRQPIILLADRQTTGGYPKIATVISADLPVLGRMAPGATFGFAAVTAREAVEIARAEAVAEAGRIATIGRYHPPGEIDAEALYRGDLISPPIDIE